MPQDFSPDELPPFDSRARPQAGSLAPRQPLPNRNFDRVEPVPDITAPLDDTNSTLMRAGYEPINIPRGGMSGNRGVPGINGQESTFGENYQNEIQSRQYPF